MPPSIENPDSLFPVQNSIFENLIKKEKSQVLMFVLRNAPIFRNFADNLDPALWETWKQAANDDNIEARAVLEEMYAKYRDEVESSLSQLDPDAFTALMEAVENGDVDTASKILEAHLEKKRSGE